jgi:hypothetical protein
MSSVALQLRDSVRSMGQDNGLVEDLSYLLLKTWRRSIRRVGGFWLGTTEISSSEAGRDLLDELFEFGMLRDIREISGGEMTWRGAVAKMEYKRGGDVFVRDISTMANAIRSIYTSIGDNLLTNGSGESGAWTSLNGATVTQDVTWATHGTYSIKVVVADTDIRGATVQTSLTIAANVQYVLRASLKVSSGSWRIAVNRTDNDQSLTYFSTSGRQGEMVVDVSIPQSSVYAGTARLVITSEASVGTLNVDAMVFQLGPVQAQTGWYTDTASIAVHGRKENVLLRGGKSNSDANAECQSLLIDRGWPNPQPPRNSQTWLAQKADDTLNITFAGYWAMLNWVYTTLHGTRSCSAWVAALSGLVSDYVTPGVVDTNATDFFIDDRAPLKVGDLLREIADVGETGGSKFSIGVWADRKLNYERIPQMLSYYRRNGRLYNVSGGEMEPWLARPGWALWQDMPIGPGALTGNAQHDPRWVYLEEVEMLADGSIAFKLD